MRGGHDDAGKGSVQRKVGNRAEWERRWSRIFSPTPQAEQDLLGPSVLGSGTAGSVRDVGVDGA